MRSLIKKIEFPVNEIDYHLNKIREQVVYLKTNFCYDKSSSTFFNWLLDQIETLSKITKSEVRFDYLTIQNEIDRLYKSDSSITGVQINFDFTETDIPNRAKFNVLTSKEH